MTPRQRIHMVLLGDLEEYSVREVCQGAAEYAAARPDLDFDPWATYRGRPLPTIADLNRADCALLSEASLLLSCGPHPHLTVPHVFYLANNRHPDAPAVELDESAIGRLAAEHLANRGYRQLAFFGCAAMPWSALRRQGFHAAATALGLPVREYEFPADTLPVYRSARLRGREQGLYQALRSLPQPCGIFAANDVTACYVIQEARLLGLRIPEQLGVIGADDDPIPNAAAGLAVSTIQLPFREVGRRAAALLDRWRRGQATPPRSSRPTNPHPANEAARGDARPPDLLLEGERPASRLLGRRTGSGTRFAARLSLVLPPVRVIVRTSTNEFMVEDTLVRRAQTYIEEHRAERVRVAAVVKALHTTTVTLGSHFAQHLKLTPAAYILERRLEHAKDLLRAGGLTVQQVSEACQFHDCSYFCQIFKRATGQSPGRFRLPTESATVE